MRKFSMMPILVLAMALGFVSCSASDDGVNDGMLGQQTTTFMPSFSMLSLVVRSSKTTKKRCGEHHTFVQTK